jgi:hypothetical protein
MNTKLDSQIYPWGLLPIAFLLTIAALCPDIDLGTVILVEGDGLLL